MINVFYYFNLIPPVPLAMDTGLVAHDVRKINNDYIPTSDQIKFNLLTEDGIYQISANGEDIMAGNSEHINLYKEVDKIMTLIRQKSEE